MGDRLSPFEILQRDQNVIAGIELQHALHGPKKF
jgi:hypothetical protein